MAGEVVMSIDRIIKMFRKAFVGQGSNDRIAAEYRLSAADLIQENVELQIKLRALRQRESDPLRALMDGIASRHR